MANYFPVDASASGTNPRAVAYVPLSKPGHLSAAQPLGYQVRTRRMLMKPTGAQYNDLKRYFGVGPPHRVDKTTGIEFLEFSTHGSLLHFEAVPVPSKPLRRAECDVVFGDYMKSVGAVRLEDSAETVRWLVSEGKPLKGGNIQWDRRIKKFYLFYTFDRPARGVPTEPAAAASHRSHARLQEKALMIEALQSRVDNRKGKTSSNRTSRQRHRTTRQLKLKLAKERVKLDGLLSKLHI